MERAEAMAYLGLDQRFNRVELDLAFTDKANKAQSEGDHELVSKLMRARKILIQNPPTESAPSDADIFKEQKLALQFLLSTKTNVFITGPGGTGKSGLLKALVHGLTDRVVTVVAPTGTAAMNLSPEVKAATTNSFFKMATHEGLSFDDHSKMTPVEKSKFQTLDLLIIDEVSMLSADFIDAISLKLQAARRNPKSFGGLQIFMFGDPFQLPPVPPKDPLMSKKLRDKYPGGDWFFFAEAYENSKFDVLELQTNLRVKASDSSKEFIERLREIRVGDISAETLEYFNKRVGKTPNTKPYYTVVARNNYADPINASEMRKLPGKDFRFEGKFEKANPASEMTPNWKDVPAEEVLTIKVGAQVMFTKNDDQGGRLLDGKNTPRWANGHEGIVKEIDVEAKTISVWHKPSKKIFEVKTSAWEVVRHEATIKILAHGGMKDALEPKIQARYIQFPIRLAWALTIHKSQGQTYDGLIFDPTDASQSGQTYVALSRATSIEGLALSEKLSTDLVRVDPQVVLYMTHCNPIHVLTQNI